MCFNVICVIILYSALFINGQDEEVTTVAPIPIICSKCTCADGTVDCRTRNIVESFNAIEWNELKSQNPKEVDLSDNSIQTLTQISELKIEKLNLSNNELEHIDDWSFKYLENLTTLDLSGNKLTEVRKQILIFLNPQNKPPFGQLKSFSKMKYLSLANNNLHAITKDAFTFIQSLTFLDMSGNPLRTIDQVTMGTLSEFTLLKELRLSGCELDNMPIGFFRTFRRLEKLDLSNNKFTKVPTSLNEPGNLRYLNFNKNPITELNEKTSISSLTKLKELQLCNTKLQTIGPGALGELKSLEILYISNNKKLTVIDEDFLTWIDDDDETKMWPLVMEIYLKNNNLSVIDPDILYRWDSVRVMNFDDNPYVCDCNAQWMIDVLVPLTLSLGSSSSNSTPNLMCSKPQELRGLTFGQLYSTSKTLACDPAGIQALPGPDIAIILGAMIGAFITFPLVLIIVLLWKKGYFAKCRKEFNSVSDSDEENDAF